MLKDSLIVLASYQEVGKFSLWSLLRVKAEKYVRVRVQMRLLQIRVCVFAFFKYEEHKECFRCFFRQHAINLRIVICDDFLHLNVEKKTRRISSLFENSYALFLQKFQVSNLQNRTFLWPVHSLYWSFETCWGINITHGDYLCYKNSLINIKTNKYSSYYKLSYYKFKMII